MHLSQPSPLSCPHVTHRKPGYTQTTDQPDYTCNFHSLLNCRVLLTSPTGSLATHRLQTSLTTRAPFTALFTSSKHWFTTSFLGGRCRKATLGAKLQALVYDILPSTTAVFSYAIGSRKLSANEQFFVGVQTLVNLLQTTQIKQGVSFTAANKVKTPAQIKPQSFESRRNSFFYPGWMRLIYSLISTQTFRRALTASVDSCAEIKRAPSVA